MRRLVIDASVLLAAPVGRPDGSPSLLLEAASRVLVEERVLLVEMVRGVAVIADDPLTLRASSEIRATTTSSHSPWLPVRKRSSAGIATCSITTASNLRR